MWKRPSRPDHSISQTFNSGVLTVYRVTDAAQPGRKPVPALERKISMPYEDRRVGISRYDEALQAQARVDRVVRVPDSGVIVLADGGTQIAARVDPQDVAVTEDGAQYRIELVQRGPDVWPRCVDLTLSRVAQIYETIIEREEGSV